MMARIVFSLLLLALGCGGALAQSKPSREEEQLRRLRGQAQQLQQALGAERQARQSAELELQSLKLGQGAELEQLRSEINASKGAAGRARRQVDKLETDLAAEREARDALMRQMEALQARIDARERDLYSARDALARTEGDLGASRAKAGALDERLGQCQRDNVALYRTGIEVLDHYGKQTLGERIGLAEPFSQTARVRLENLIEKWRDRLDQSAGLVGDTPDGREQSRQ